ncbi:hypothetical protein BJY00DRAFT_297366 [Aspergillus carlsbadensis]|nr:hypothetical protein BJY00DRAFT_297366 [Aspergillus carlsbadensis]
MFQPMRLVPVSQSRRRHIESLGLKRKKKLRLVAFLCRTAVAANGALKISSREHFTAQILGCIQVHVRVPASRSWDWCAARLAWSER